MPQRPPEPPQLHSRNRKGDIAELAFAAKAMRFGFNVLKPVNTNCSYDCVVEVLGQYRRIQVKSAWKDKVEPGKGQAYCVRVCRTRGHQYHFYSADETDFLAAYVAAEDAWYIIPGDLVESRTTVGLFPHNPHSRGRFELYREAWDLLVPREVVIKDLKAAADLSRVPEAPESESVPSLRSGCE